MIADAKTDYHDSLCKSLNNNGAGSKDYWVIIRKLLGQKFATGVPALETKDGVFCSDRQKCQLFLHQFMSKFHHDYDERVIPTRTRSLIDSVQVSPQSIRKLLMNLDPSKQGGEDEISNHMLKLVSLSLDVPLARLFNTILDRGIFPNCWKLGIIVPVFKNKVPKSSPDNYRPVTLLNALSSPDNYRPVTLLNALSKLFERSIYSSILYHINSNNLLFERQSGFLACHDTQKQLVSIVHSIIYSFENGMVTRGGFLDIAGAFDSVPHFILLRKLYAYGIRGRVLELIKSYLCNRCVKIKVNDCYSDESHQGVINSGVPNCDMMGSL
jgi:hypothetical protein